MSSTEIRVFGVDPTPERSSKIDRDASANRLIGTGVLPLLEQFEAAPCVIRDESLVLRWCNDAYARLAKQPRGTLIGTRMEAYISGAAAEERAAVLRQVIKSGRSDSYYQFGADQRLLCCVFPIEEASFGYKGALVTMQHDTGMAGQSCVDVRVLGTPCLDDLDVLSPAELRVLHHLGKGGTTAEIGERLSRSAKTIEKQIESVHRKLGTSSRAELVKLAVERGLQAFSAEQWETIIEGARAIRRSAN